MWLKQRWPIKVLRLPTATLKAPIINSSLKSTTSATIKCFMKIFRKEKTILVTMKNLCSKVPFLQSIRRKKLKITKALIQRSSSLFKAIIRYSFSVLNTYKMKIQRPICSKRWKRIRKIYLIVKRREHSILCSEILSLKLKQIF